MTEGEWLACNDPQRMVIPLKGKVSNRKIRLFLVACARLVWNQIPDASLRTGVEPDDPRYDWLAMAMEMRRAVEVGEKYADGLALASERESSNTQLGRHSLLMQTTIHQVARMMGLTYNHFTAIFGLCFCAVLPRSGLNRLETTDHWQAGLLLTAQHQPSLLRDIIGNPLRPVFIDPSCLAWNDAIIPSIAEGIYAERAFGRMPILHDALLDAGCNDEVLLSHCRNPEGHVRGCWALDLILGKE
jgi:hypothetical protein